jgi:hypothetical protein
MHVLSIPYKSSSFTSANFFNLLMSCLDCKNNLTLFTSLTMLSMISPNMYRGNDCLCMMYQKRF